MIKLETQDIFLKFRGHSDKPHLPQKLRTYLWEADILQFCSREDENVIFTQKGANFQTNSEKLISFVTEDN